MKRFVTVMILSLCCLAASAQQDTLRILGFGNSWTRDSMRWLSAIAKSAGRPVIVGHAYLGGSSLVNQYFGIDDPAYQYKHGKQMQTVHSTYQYWKYNCSVNPVKTPESSVYKNGLNNCGVTLESAVKDEPWDIIVFQPSITGLAGTRLQGMIGRDPDSEFNMNRLVDRVKAMMAPEVAAKVRTGLMVPFSYPEGNTDYRKNAVDMFNGGVTPANQEEWDALYEKQHRIIQQNITEIADFMGDNCSFLINVGLAIYNSRHNRYLVRSGYKLQRAQDNTHLSEGIAMYIASLCYAYELLGIGRGEAVFYPATSRDPQLDGDTGKTVYTNTHNTAFMADQARREAWNAQMCCPLR